MTKMRFPSTGLVKVVRLLFDTGYFFGVPRTDKRGRTLLKTAREFRLFREETLPVVEFLKKRDRRVEMRWRPGQ